MNFAIVDSGVSGASSWIRVSPFADGQHRLADALLLVGLLVHRLHAEGLGVERDRLVQVGDGDAHVVDGGEQLGGQPGMRRQWSRGHPPPRRLRRHIDVAGFTSGRAGMHDPVARCACRPILMGSPTPRGARGLPCRRGRPRRRPGTGGPPWPPPSRSVIVSGARTPMGRLLGSLKDFSAADLGGVAIKAALERAGISGDQVDYVIMGQVLQAGAGQNPARPAAVAAGIPMSVPSFTLNKVCLSGLDAIALADQLIRAGEFDDRRRRWHGVDDPGAAPAGQLAHRHQVRRHEAHRLDGPRRPLRHLRPGRDGRAHRAGQQPLRPDPRGAGRLRRGQPPAGRRRAEERPVRRRDHPGAHPAAQGRPDRVHRRRGHPRRHDGRQPRASSSRPSPRTARSPPAPPRRSPTAPARSSS